MSENPGEPLYEFLHSNGLESIYTKFGEKNIDLDLPHLIDIESSDLQQLCNELDLNIEQSIKFKKIVKILNQNHQNGSHHLALPPNSSNHSINNIADNMIDYKLKIVLAGDSATGKTSLIRRYLNNKFDSDYVSTIGIDFGKKTILTPDNSYVQLHIWDTCGQERFDSVSSQYFRGAHCIIIVYDITQRNSFNCIEKRWINTIKENCENATYVVLVGNKLDKRIAKQKALKLKLKHKQKQNNKQNKGNNKQKQKKQQKKIESDSSGDDMDIEYNGEDVTENDKNGNEEKNDYSEMADDGDDQDDGVLNAETADAAEQVAIGKDCGSSKIGININISKMVSSEEGLFLAKKHNFEFCETSAKSGHHIPSLFLMCAVNSLERKEELGLIHLKSQQFENISNYSQNEGRPNVNGGVDLNNGQGNRSQHPVWSHCGCN